MRKRTQRKSKPVEVVPKHVVQKKPVVEKKSFSISKNWWIAFSLIAIFFLVLLFNTYFNFDSNITYNPDGTGLDKYYLSGPDPYYNMRIVDETLYGENKGHYQFYSEADPLLNYPIGQSGSRAPLLNMAAIGFSTLLSPFMDEIDAVGLSMQFIPALFGALLVFPVYFIGKTLFNKKAALIGALFIAIIPIHLGSGHGSAFSLFDHDSFNLLLFFLTFLFFIKSMKEKELVKSSLYALLAGISIAALSMVWVEARFLYAIIAAYIIVQMVIDIFTSKIEKRIFLISSITLFSGYIISLPVTAAKEGGFSLDVSFYLCVAIAAFGAVYYIFGKKKIPWTISLPAVFCAAGIGLTILYFIEEIAIRIPSLGALVKVSEIIFGSGIYGNKVSMTIAEANTYQISQAVMSFGPAIYWAGWGGLILLMYYYFKDKERRDYLFISMLFIVDLWLTSTAGRFTNDMVPLIAILGGWIIWKFFDWLDFKQMIKDIKSAGGGIHGLKRGVKLLHVFGIVFIALLFIFPNAYLALDNAIPYAAVEHNNETIGYKQLVFGENYSGAYGMSIGKETYWVDAYNWLVEQDTQIEDPFERPAYIAWWDYGFYGSALSEHPMVADNFQDGIPPAANFHTAISEEDAVSVWITRILEGHHVNNGGISEEVKQVLRDHLGNETEENVTKWMEEGRSPSFGDPIGDEFDEEISKNYHVGQQYSINSVYHGISNLLTTNYTDEEITWLYLGLIDATGYSIRYYGVEGYDKQIFNIFGFLADKSLLMLGAPEDEFAVMYYTGYELDSTYGNVIDYNKRWLAKEYLNFSDDEKKVNQVAGQETELKDVYFDTMMYRTYVGPSTGTSGSKSEATYQMPCVNMRHFCAEYISNVSKGVYYTNIVPVVIAKYYAGACLNGSVEFMGGPFDARTGSEIVVQKNIPQLDFNYGQFLPIDHDKQLIGADGGYSVIAPAGEITLQIRRNTELGPYAFVLKNVTFDSSDEESMTLPITDEESMRKSGNFNRVVNITIEPGYIEGYVYLDTDEDGMYNSSVDETLSGVDVYLYEVFKFDQDQFEQSGLLNPADTGSALLTNIDDTAGGYYNFTDLMPGYYAINIYLDGDYLIHNTILRVDPGEMSHDIAKPKPTAVEGMVYFDENKNDEYDSGEEMENVDIELSYVKTTDDSRLLQESITSQTGAFSFDSLIPGQYELKVTKENNYETKKIVILPENETIKQNISIKYATITLSGETKSQITNFDNVTIKFSVDKSVENNTAVKTEAKSDSAGAYTIDIMPGSYNVTASTTVNESGTDIIYSYDGQLTIPLGGESGTGTKTLDIVMAKEE